MIERDLSLSKELASVLDRGSEPEICLMSSRYTSLVRVNLVLLKVFLDEKKYPGIMVTIDRPHQYISHLLQLHGIDQSRLTFLDAISKYASDTKGGVRCGEYEDGPFYIERLPEYLAGSDPRRTSSVDINAVNFIIVDNVSTLLTYNSMDSLKEFFRRYVEVTRERTTGCPVTVFAMDKELHRGLFEFISTISTKVIDLTPDMRIGDVKDLRSHREGGV